MFERMAHHWSPLEQLTGYPDHWLMVDGHRKVAIIKLVMVEPMPEKLLRSVTYHDDPAQRWLIGYFTDLRHAAAVSWWEWLRDQGKINRSYE